jgi:hypothetical protein
MEIKYILLLVTIPLFVLCNDGSNSDGNDIIQHNEDKLIEIEQANENNINSFEGFWLDIVDNKIDASHIMIIDIISNDAIILDFKINKNEITNNTFKAVYNGKIIEYPASPLALLLEYYDGSEIEDKPSIIKDTDSVIKITQFLSLPESEPEIFTGYFIKIKNDYIETFLEAFAN